MIKFTSISLRNFLSYGNVPTLINLDVPGTTLILGEDLDNTANGKIANGTGKSSIINALCYALYDNPVSNISKDNLVNNINKKHMEVVVEFEKDGTMYKVIRARKMKAGATGNYVQLFENGKEISVMDTTSHIKKIIGLPYELFVRIVVFSASHTPFLDLPVSGGRANQTDIIEELFDLTTLSVKAEALKEVIKDTKQRIEIHKTRVETLEEERGRHQQQIVTAKQRVVQWEQTHNDALEKTREQLNDINQIDILEQERLFEQRTLLSNQVGELQRNKAEKIQIIDNEISILTKDFDNEISILTKDFDNELATVNASFDNELANIRTRIENSKAQQVEPKKFIPQKEKSIAQYDKLIKDCNNQIEQIRQDIAHLESNTCPLCKQKYPNSQEKISEFEGKLKELEQTISEYELGRDGDQNILDTLNNTIRELNNEIATASSALATKEAERSLAISQKTTEKKKAISEVESRKNETLSVKSIERKKVQQKYDDEIMSINVVIKTINNDLVVETIDKLHALKNQSAVLQSKIEELEKAENPFIDPLLELESTDLGKVNYEDLNNLTTLQEHQSFLLKLLTKKDSFVRKALINKNIPYLNGRLQHYLTILGLPHKVEFTHEMTCTISQFGRDLDFGNLSAGQRARVNMALSFAFRDVLQNLHTRINVCLLDEVLDIGLDSIGVQAAARLLKRKARDEGLSLFIISHRNEIDSAFDRTLTVQLNKGFSQIKETV